MQRPANSSGRRASSRPWPAGSAQRISQTSRHPCTTFHAAIAEHCTARDLRKKERADLDVKQKLLAEKKLAYSRLLQQQQNLAKERDAEEKQAKNLEAQLALIADEEAEYHRIEKTAGSYEELRQRLDKLREKKSEFLRLSAELGFADREIADLTARAEKQKAQIKALDIDVQKKAEFIARVRAGLGAGEIAEDRLETAVSYRLAEINKQAGTLAARLAQYEDEQKKIAADQRTIREAGADGICPLCRQKLGEHFGSIEAEFTNKLQDLENRAVADLARQEKLQKEKIKIESLKPVLASVRTLDAKLRQKPVYEEELAGLEEQWAKKELAQLEIYEALAKLGYDDGEFKACEQETAAVQKVQIRFIELGKKIGQGLMVKQHLAGITAKIAERTAGLAHLAEEIKAAAFDPAEAVKLDAAITETEAALRTEEVHIATATRDLRFTEEKIAEYKKVQEQIAAFTKPGKRPRRRDRAAETHAEPHRRVRHLPHAGGPEPARRRSQPDHRRDHGRAVRAGAAGRGLQPPRAGRGRGLPHRPLQRRRAGRHRGRTENRPLALPCRAPPGAREHRAHLRRDLREPGRGAPEQPPHRPPHAGVPLPADPAHLAHRRDAGRVCQHARDRDGSGRIEPGPGGGVRREYYIFA